MQIVCDGVIPCKTTTTEFEGRAGSPLAETNRAMSGALDISINVDHPFFSLFKSGESMSLFSMD